jgi:DivIVA domain-containing protein
VSAEKPSEAGGAKAGHPPSSPEPEHKFGDLRRYVPADVLNASFPLAVRGYDRSAVDAYIKRVNRVIAELKVSASPRAAVTHALEQTEQQVSGLLEQARDTGEEITASASQEAEEIVAAAKAEAAELLVNVSDEADRTRAEAEQLIANARTEAEDILTRSRLQADSSLADSRAKAKEERKQLEEALAALREEAKRKMRELQAETEGVWQERSRLLEDIRGRASGLLELADAAAARQPEDAVLEPEAPDHIEPAVVETTDAAAADANSRVQRKRRRTGS